MGGGVATTYAAINSSAGSPVNSSPGSPINSSPNVNTVSSTPSNPISTKLENPLKVESIRDVIFLVVDLAIWLGTAFAILAIIFVGFKFIYAQGKPEEIKEAKMWFMYIIIGLAILISAKTITVIIQNTLVDSGVVNKDAFGK